MPSRSSSFLARSMLVVTATTCTPFKDDGTDADGATDFEVPDAAATPACNPGAPFGPAVPVPGLTASMGTAISGVRLSRDYLLAYFQAEGRADTAGYDDLYTAMRASLAAPFDNIAPLAGHGVDTVGDEFAPSVGGDGLSLVFARAPSPGDAVHIFYATRATASIAFSDVGLLAGVNDLQAMQDTMPFLREDGGEMYFASTRVPAQSTNIYSAAWTGEAFGAADDSSMQSINTSFSETAPVVSPDGLTLYYGSDRSDGDARGGYDIWVATRPSTSVPFSAAVNVTELNTSSLELPTFVTRDGCTLYFSSDRTGLLSAYVATKPGS